MSAHMNGNTPHILIVDDDELARNLINIAIQRNGYKTSLASSASEGLDSVRKGRFDVVIADIKMPDMTGLELLKLIKEEDAIMPVILLTSSDQLEDALSAIRLGAHDYLIKPSNVREIRDSIARAIILRDKLNKMQRNTTIIINFEALPRFNFTRFFKRIMDILASVVALILFSPIMLILFLVIRLQMGSPAIFKQERPGLRGRPFTMYKFRSMKNLPAHKVESTSAQEDVLRVTSLGKFLRKTSLDELPEFFNVLKGDMSLVGPRPLIMRYLDRYPPHPARRHEVKPGITGWAQVNGRNATSWEKRLEMDVWYVDHMSIWLDIKIILVTIRQVLLREGGAGTVFSEYFEPPEEELDLSPLVEG